MLVLDTDHIGEIQKGTSESAERLRDRLIAAGEPAVTTIISVEEQMRGWLAAIHREKDPIRQIRWYARLQHLFSFFSGWTVLPWDDEAAVIFEDLRKSKIRIGTMDLKIASIALASGALLLSRNLNDFNSVPDLNVEDWLS